MPVSSFGYPAVSERNSSLKSLDHNPLTINETGFVTVTEKAGLFSWFDGDVAVMRNFLELREKSE